MSISIVYPKPELFPSFYEALTAVAKERVYIEMVEPPPFERVAAHQAKLSAADGPVYYALDGEKVIGWCDIWPLENPRQKHRGSMGMGVLAEYRGQGVGSKLLTETLKHAARILEKVELSVYTSNVGAIALYKKFGFEQEGLIRNYRKVDGRVFDCIQMAKHFTPAG